MLLSRRWGAAGATGMLALLLSGCGDPAPEVVAPPTVTTQPQRPSIPGAADMVSAVTLNGADAPVNLRFALQSRPQLNEPLELQFVLSPSRDIDSAQITFEPSDSVGIAADVLPFNLAHTAAGTGAVQKLVVVPKQSGVLSLTAVVAVDLPTGTMARSFSIPILVIPGEAAAKAKPAT